MTTTSPLATLWGKIARVPLLKRGQQQKRRFLCPNCLHFGAFAFACGECWSELPEYANGKNTETCPRCQRSLLSADGDVVRAYCQQCKGNYERAIYHQREVRVLATLRTADSQSLYRAINGQEAQPQGGKNYVYDDGVQLTYVLNLSTLADIARSLHFTHAFWEVEFVWLDSGANTSLELVEDADRFIRQANLTEEQGKVLTVCVSQDVLAPAARIWLEAHFRAVKIGVAAAVFFSEIAQTNVVAPRKIGTNFRMPKPIITLKDSDPGVRWGVVQALGKIGDASAVPALIAELKSSDQKTCERAAKALGKIGMPAVPALLATLKDSDDNVRWNAKEVLGTIGKPVVPLLIAALKDSDPGVRRGAAEALGKIGDASAVPALIAELKSSDWEMCSRAAIALGDIGDKAAVPALQAAHSWSHNIGDLCLFCMVIHKLEPEPQFLLRKSFEL